jgi:hypothetical protein
LEHPDAAGLDLPLGFHGPCPLFFGDRRSPSLVWAWKTREINHQPPKSQAHLAADSGMQEPASLASSWLVALQRATGYWRDAGFDAWQRSRHVLTNVVMLPLAI